jgi:hypothetical protein
MSEDTNPTKRAGERFDKVIGDAPCEFERGVKLITREKRLDRAMPWFRRFIRSRNDSEKAGEVLAFLRKQGITAIQVGLWRSGFRRWKREEKSRSAKKSATSRKKVG